MKRHIKVEFDPIGLKDVRVVLALDFGTTYSGFCFAKVKGERDEEIISFRKIPTSLQNDGSDKDVDEVNSILVEMSGKRMDFDTMPVPIEPFKLDFMNGDLPTNQKITEYLRYLMTSNMTLFLNSENPHYNVIIENEIRYAMRIRWPKLDFFDQVLLVVTVPAEISEEAKAIMRLCLMDANFIDRPGTQKLQFISE
ncbi:1951_t:CDS:2, partial [Funneliformis mosseae]